MKHPVDTSAWGEFVVGELFDNIYSVRQVKSQRNIVDELKGIPFVVQTQTNNMVKCYASKNTFDEHNVPIIKGNSIAMGVDLAVISYQENDYGGSHIIVAESDKLNPLRGKFIVAIMTAKLGPKYNYVNKPGVQKYKQDVIPLPLKPSANPSNYSQEDINWDYMETVMSRVTARAKERLANLPQPTDKKKTPVDTSAWGEFVVGELFECNTTKAFYPTKENLPEGETPYISRSTYDNGVSGHYNDINDEFTIHQKCITIGAETGIAFWQEKPFIPGVKVYTISHEQLNSKNALFVTTVLNKSADNYGFTQLRSMKKLKAESIKLPLKPSADPSNYSQDDIDWDYMESFMKAIEEKAQTRLKTLQKSIA